MVVDKQLAGTREALSKESNALRLFDLSVELLNTYDHIWYIMDYWIEESSPKNLLQYIKCAQTRPQTENIPFILVIVAVGLLFAIYAKTIITKIHIQFFCR